MRAKLWKFEGDKRYDERGARAGGGHPAEPDMPEKKHIQLGAIAASSQPTICAESSLLPHGPRAAAELQGIDGRTRNDSFEDGVCQL